MPTNANAYNSRVTDEALEKRFRDTFRSQGGAELVDDLYASGVIIPIVDFTQAAEGSQLPQNLQTAWDFATGFTQVDNTTATIINTAGFWQIDVSAALIPASTGARNATVTLSDGLSTKKIWQFSVDNTSDTTTNSTTDERFVVFVRSGDSVALTGTGNWLLNAWYRQIATVNGDLVNPTGFTSS